MKINSTSRKNTGAAENNREQIREIVETKQDLGSGKFILTDKAGNKILVDTVRGLTGLLINDNIRWYEDGTTSSKSNGYVYTDIAIIDTDGNLKTIAYGTHALIAMVAFTDSYDMIADNDKTPICNHRNNCHWDNRAENLEWTTLGGNNRHGKIVASLYHHFGDKYVHIYHNRSDKEFMVLDNQLSVKDIERYTTEIKNPCEFKCNKEEYINEEVISAFVNWLIDNGIWTDNLGGTIYE